MSMNVQTGGDDENPDLNTTINTTPSPGSMAEGYSTEFSSPGTK